jgi:hypothetical protein
MKAKVVKEFRDKYTGETHKNGKVLDISEERFEEILTVGAFVEKVEEPKKKATKKMKEE